MSSHIEITIKKADPVTVAFISMKGAYTQIPNAFGKLFEWMGQKGLVPAGPPMGAYFNTPGQVPEEQLLWEIRCPLAGDVAPSGPDDEGLGIKRVEGADIATAMHKGPYDQVGPTWDALVGWIKENGYEIAGPGVETYLSDPEKTPPEELLTEAHFPIRKR